MERCGDPLMQLAVGASGRIDETALGVAPQRCDPRLHIAMGEQLQFELLTLGEQLGIVAQPMSERDQPHLDRATHLVAGIVADVAEKAGHAVVDLREDPVVDRVSEPTTATPPRAGVGTPRGCRGGSPAIR